MGKDKKSKKEKKSTKSSNRKEAKHEKKSKLEKKDHKESRSKPDILISADDYFLKAEEFRVYLHSKKIAFESLTSEKAHELFADDFVKKYNKGKLSSMFYSSEGIPAQVREAAVRTQHKWTMKLSDTERDALSRTTESIHRSTKDAQPTAWAGTSNSSALASTSGRPLVAPRLSDLLSTAEMHAITTSKETGRDALVAKRKERGDAVKGAHNEREAGKDGLDAVSEKFLLGDSAADLAALKSRQQQQQAHRQSQQQQKISVLAEKEREREEAWRTQLGLPLDGTMKKITIAPRPAL